MKPIVCVNELTTSNQQLHLSLGDQGGPPTNRLKQIKMNDITKTITGEDVLMIKRTNIVRQYNSETENFKGKSYRVYAFGDKAFAVHEDDAFHADFDKGDIQKIMVTESTDGWSLANHVTWTRANAFKKAQVYNESITVENFKPSFQPAQAISDLQ